MPIELQVRMHEDAQRAAAEAAAAQRRRVLEWFLLCCGPGQGQDAIGFKRQEGCAMRYATLVFARARYEAVATEVDGHERLLSHEEASRHYADMVRSQREAHAEHVERVERRRAAFIAKAGLESNVSVRRDTGGLMKSKVEFDLVTIDGAAREVPPGTGRAFLQQEAAKKYPSPQPPADTDFEHWFRLNKTEVRTWVAEMIESGSASPVELHRPSWKWGFPIQVATRELERLSGEGWSLVHVSEDRGLYRGEDAADESYPTRVRYLLGRPD